MTILDSSPRVAVVGGGATGMGAALSAAESGVEVLLVDEQPARRGRTRRLPRGVTVWNDSLAWGLTPQRQLAVLRDGRTHFAGAAALVLACGVEDRAVPFPGWTLPGVVSAGEWLTTEKAEALVSGRRALVVGTGADLHTAADHVLRHGGRIAAILEASGIPPRSRRAWPTSVTVLEAHTLLRAEGEDRVRRAVAIGLDDSWRPCPGTERPFDADLVIYGFGVRPAIELARLAGCAHDYDERRGCWVTRHDGSMETTVPDIFVAGQGSPFHGAAIAETEGRLAGRRAALRVKGIAEEEARHRTATLRRHLARQAKVHAHGTWRDGLLDLVTSETVLCPCEHVRAGEIDEAAGLPGATVRDLKNQTRVATGVCQGRLCLPAAAALLARRRGVGVAALGPPSVRPPVRPLLLEALLSADEPAPPPDRRRRSATTRARPAAREGGRTR